jgi:cytochrome oxidase assembly protein ShyY1
MTYAVTAYALAAVIWIGYLLSLRARAARLTQRRATEKR